MENQIEPCIVLVDDDDAVRRSIQLLLKSHGYEVRAYPSPVGLAADAEALRCHCMIADLIMPQIDAIQLFAEMRAAGWAGRSILISGFLNSGWEIRALGAGYDRVLQKPISDSVLVRTVKDLMAPLAPTGTAC